MTSPAAPPVLSHCLRHPAREAVARCPECGRFCCRECITEHDDRVICSDCLRALAAGASAAPRRSRLAWAIPLGRAACSVLLAWLIFYTAGRLLLRIPSAFHEGTLWKTSAVSE